MCLTCLKISYTDAHFAPVIVAIPRLRKREVLGRWRSRRSLSFSLTTGANRGREKAKEYKYHSARGGRSQHAPQKMIYTCEKSKSAHTRTSLDEYRRKMGSVSLMSFTFH